MQVNIYMSCKFKDNTSIVPRCKLTQSECQFVKDAEECNEDKCDLKEAFKDAEAN